MAFDSDRFAQNIKGEIDRIPGSKKANPRETYILCPFHHEKTPSGRVRHDPSKPKQIGWFNCFGCGHFARWDELAERLGLRKFGKEEAETDTVPELYLDNLRAELLEDSRQDEREEEDLLLFPLDKKSWAKFDLPTYVWREIKYSLLRKVGAKAAYDRTRRKWFIYLPCLINTVEVGHVKAEIEKPKPYVDKKGNNVKPPSYVNSPGVWSKFKGLLFYDYAIQLMKSRGLKTMVLVEGPRDALRLLGYNIPCVCILGTQTWTAQKSQVLEFADIERLVLLLDGDEAGEICTSRILEESEGAFNFKVVKLWTYKIPKDHKEKKLDPGNMPERMVLKLESFLI